MKNLLSITDFTVEEINELLEKAQDIIKNQPLKDFVILGELSLDGEVRKINGILPMLISAKQNGYTKFMQLCSLNHQQEQG